MSDRALLNAPGSNGWRRHLALRASSCGAARLLKLRRPAAAGDFLYVDPPYAPLSETSSFTVYTSPRFGAEEQRALQQLMIELASRGCHVLLSNSTAAAIQKLYESDTQAQGAGLRALRVPARRAVNSNAARRGPVDEYVITNIDAEVDPVAGERPAGIRTSRRSPAAGARPSFR